MVWAVIVLFKRAQPLVSSKDGEEITDKTGVKSGAFGVNLK